MTKGSIFMILSALCEVYCASCFGVAPEQYGILMVEKNDQCARRNIQKGWTFVA